MEVHGHLIHEVESVADVDQRSRVRQFRFYEELFHFLWVIHDAVSAHSLHLHHATPHHRDRIDKAIRREEKNGMEMSQG